MFGIPAITTPVCYVGEAMNQLSETQELYVTNDLTVKNYVINSDDSLHKNPGRLYAVRWKIPDDSIHNIVIKCPHQPTGLEDEMNEICRFLQETNGDEFLSQLFERAPLEESLNHGVLPDRLNTPEPTPVRPSDHGEEPMDLSIPGVSNPGCPIVRRGKPKWRNVVAITRRSTTSTT